MFRPVRCKFSGLLTLLLVILVLQKGNKLEPLKIEEEEVWETPKMKKNPEQVSRNQEFPGRPTSECPARIRFPLCQGKEGDEAGHRKQERPFIIALLKQVRSLDTGDYHHTCSQNKLG